MLYPLNKSLKYMLLPLITLLTFRRLSEEEEKLRKPSRSH
jgi:hypothetical protein